MPRDYRLYDLTDHEFELLIVRICIRWLGEGVRPFAPGPDGGRDGAFHGTANEFPSADDLIEGTSYKKLVCALFDLALLKVYEDAPFFHFVYHDGILEGLDDRKKLAFLNIVREQVASRKTQYIMTMIDSDMPRNSKDERVEFPGSEIVLRLHDDGPDGRLFKMAEF